MRNSDSFVLHTEWRIVDSQWCNVVAECIHGCEHIDLPPSLVNLSDWLSLYGFDIDDSVTYCLADNGQYSLKYRLSGGKISIYVSSSKFSQS